MGIKLKILAFFSTLILYISIIPLLCLLTPIYIFRIFVKILAKIFRKDLGKMLTSVASLLSTDKIWKDPHANVITCIVLNGHLDLKYFRKIGKERILEARNPKTGEFKYPELRQTITNWLGFAFWKNVKNFKIEDCIKEYFPPNGELLSEENFGENFSHLISKVWEKDKPLWRFLLCNNYKEIDDPNPKSIVMFLNHHSLSDGFGLINLFFNAVDEEGKSKLLAKPKRFENLKKANIFKRVFFNFFDVLTFPYQTYKILAFKNDRKFMNSINLPKNITAKQVGTISQKIPFKLIKEIKDKHRVYFTSVIFAGIAAANRQLFLKRGVKDLPKYINCAIPFITSTKREKLRNYLAGSIMLLPINEPDPIKRLKEINKSFKALKQTNFHFLAYYLNYISGCLFTWIIKIGPNLTTEPPFFTALSSFPGPSDEISLFQLPVDSWFFGCGLLTPPLPIGVYLFSYNGEMRLLGGGSQSLFPTIKDSKEFLDSVLKEIEILYGEEIP